MRLTKNERILLNQIREKDALFDVGRCPVEAVSIGLDLSVRGLVSIGECRISITEAGRAALSEDE